MVELNGLHVWDNLVRGMIIIEDKAFEIIG